MDTKNKVQKLKIRSNFYSVKLFNSFYGWLSKLFKMLEAILDGASTIVFIAFGGGGNTIFGGLFLMILIGDLRDGETVC